MKRHLKALEMLPEVIEALTSLAEDAERLRAAMAKASGLGVLPPTSDLRPPTKLRPDRKTVATEPQSLMLPTPERAEFEAERANPAPYNPEAEEEPAYKQRQRAMMEAVRGDPRRQARLSQFAHDGPEEEVAQ